MYHHLEATRNDIIPRYPAGLSHLTVITSCAKLHYTLIIVGFRHIDILLGYITVTFSPGIVQYVCLEERSPE
jgi:hypothetical protein